MKRVIAATAFLVALGSGVTTAAAAPPDRSAPRHICEANGGRFSENFLESGDAGVYLCAPETIGFTHGELTAARAVCENAYGGRFFEPFEFFGTTQQYVCLVDPDPTS